MPNAKLHQKTWFLPVIKANSRTATTSMEVNAYEPVRIELLGRRETFTVTKASRRSMNTLGRLPLMLLDFVVDPQSQKLIGNPEHGGVQMTEIF